MKQLAIAFAFGAITHSPMASAHGSDNGAGHSGDTAQPTQTQARTDLPIPPDIPKCADGMVWDIETDQCVAPDHQELDDLERLEAVREYAYSGQFDLATRVLDRMQDQSADGVLTYRGFLAQKTGDRETGMAWYQRAVAQNADNLMARSYMGQALVDADEIDQALVQLSEIQNRGGTNSWPERALRLAIDRSESFSGQ